MIVNFAPFVFMIKGAFNHLFVWCTEWRRVWNLAFSQLGIQWMVSGLSYQSPCLRGY